MPNKDQKQDKAPAEETNTPPMVSQADAQAVQPSTSKAPTALVKALAKVQGAMKPAAKDATNPHFKSNYATLASVWEACREHLAKNGFAIIQQPLPQSDDSMLLNTILLHESGESINCLYPVVYDRCGSQALGAALTYARRYSLASMVGVAPADDDDDGNRAPAPPPRRQQPVQQAPAAPPPATPPQLEGRPTLKDQAMAYIAKVEAASTWEGFMQVIADAGDLVERIRAADKQGNWIARINEIVGAKRAALEPAGDTQQEKESEAPGEQQPQDTEKAAG